MLRKNLAVLSVLAMFFLSAVSVVNADEPPADYDGMCYISAQPYLTSIYDEYAGTDVTNGLTLLFSTSGFYLHNDAHYRLMFDASTFEADYPGAQGNIGMRALFWRYDNRYREYLAGVLHDYSGYDSFDNSSMEYFPIGTYSSYFLLAAGKASEEGGKVAYPEIALPCALIPPTPTPTATNTPTPTPLPTSSNFPHCAADKDEYDIASGVNSVSLASGYDMVDINYFSVQPVGGNLSGAVSATIPAGSGSLTGQSVSALGGTVTYSGSDYDLIRLCAYNHTSATPTPGSSAPTATPYIINPTPGSSGGGSVSGNLDLDTIGIFQMLAGFLDMLGLLGLFRGVVGAVFVILAFMFVVKLLR